MLVLKIVFGIIVTLPILILAEFLFENTVAEAVVGTSKKKKKPLLQRLFPGLRRRRKKHRKDDRDEEHTDDTQNADNMGDKEFFEQFDNIDTIDNK